MDIVLVVLLETVYKNQGMGSGLAMKHVTIIILLMVMDDQVMEQLLTQGGCVQEAHLCPGTIDRSDLLGTIQMIIRSFVFLDEEMG